MNPLVIFKYMPKYKSPTLPQRQKNIYIFISQKVKSKGKIKSFSLPNSKKETSEPMPVAP